MTLRIRYDDSTPNLKGFMECVEHYSNMCGCEGEAKEAKRSECEMRYVDVVTRNMKEISEQLLNINPWYAFSNNEVFLAELKR